jgi:hypothetical protein
MELPADYIPASERIRQERHARIGGARFRLRRRVVWRSAQAACFWDADTLRSNADNRNSVSRSY